MTSRHRHLAIRRGALLRRDGGRAGGDAELRHGDLRPRDDGPLSSRTSRRSSRRDRPNRIAPSPISRPSRRGSSPVMVDWNARSRPLRRSAGRARSLRARAGTAARRVAVRFGEARLHLRELNFRANRLSRFLARQGLAPAAWSPSAWSVVRHARRLLGVMKAGARTSRSTPNTPPKESRSSSRTRVRGSSSRRRISPRGSRGTGRDPPRSRLDGDPRRRIPRIPSTPFPRSPRVLRLHLGIDRSGRRGWR